MDIVIKMDFDKRAVYIPNGYVTDMGKLQRDFLMWMEDQEQCVVANKKHLCYAYNTQTVLEYINSVVLADSRERAYEIDLPQNGKKLPTIAF